MQNFQELQAYKQEWALNHDEMLFQKISALQDNVLACTNLTSASITELNRAVQAAGTTIDNAVNAFSQLNHTKFLENVRSFTLPLYLSIYQDRCLLQAATQLYTSVFEKQLWFKVSFTNDKLNAFGICKNYHLES